MPLFYIHSAGTEEPIKPLSRKFRVREILPTDELSKTQATHSKKESDFSEVLSKAKQGTIQEDDTQEHSNQQQAAQAYRDTQTGSKLNLGKVRDIMSSPVLTIKKSQTLGEAWGIMQKYEIHHLAIVDTEEMLCGMLSEKLILPYLMSIQSSSIIQAEDLSLDNFCTQTLVSTSPDTLIKDLVPALLEYGLDGIAVTENGLLSGIATYSDILKVVLKMQAFNVDA